MLRSNKANSTKVITDDNYKCYRSSELQSGEIKWRCTSKKYNAKVYAVVYEILRRDSNCNHPAYGQKDVERFKLSTAVQRKAVEDILMKSAKLFHAAVEML